jgi:hypothetical protein
MPYIKQERRVDLTKSGHDMATSGELNFIITRILNRYREQHGDSYTTYNDIIGALEGAKLEFYRRVVVPYENTKIEENGDVY